MVKDIIGVKKGDILLSNITKKKIIILSDRYKLPSNIVDGLNLKGDVYAYKVNRYNSCDAIILESDLCDWRKI